LSESGFTGFEDFQDLINHEGRGEEERFLDKYTTFLSFTQRRKDAKEGKF
jgi:hypothetical protein